MSAELNRSNTDIATSPMPTHFELAMLGPVLCVFCERYGGELGGWLRAVSAGAHSGIDSDGWYECLSFRDRAGQDCWRLYLLPESDFFVWDHVRDRLPRAAAACDVSSVSSKTRPAQDLSITRCAYADVAPWRASVVRLHALRSANDAVLAASPWQVSALGADMVRRVLRIEGIRHRPDALP
jgi:hypothetical protein